MKLAVIGDPVEHSASPEFFRGFFGEAGVAGSYDAIRVEAGAGARVIAALRADGYRGLNVTTPLKEEALAACNRVVDPEAIAVASANVLLFQEDGIHGFNTDTTGALQTVAEVLGIEDFREGVEGTLKVAGGSDLSALRILVLGVGPTARAVIWKLNQYGANVSVWNRTIERARATAEKYKVSLWDGETVDVVFSTLPPDGELGGRIADVARAAPTLIDANYGARSTIGAQLGRNVVDGTSMLLSSARESFRLFSMPRSERFESGVTRARSVWG